MYFIKFNRVISCGQSLNYCIQKVIECDVQTVENKGQMTLIINYGPYEELKLRCHVKEELNSENSTYCQGNKELI